MRTLYALILLVLLGAVLVFAVQNTHTVTVRFVNWGMTAPIALLVVGVYVLGMMSGATVIGLINRLFRRMTDTPAHSHGRSQAV